MDSRIDLLAKNTMYKGDLVTHYGMSARSFWKNLKRIGFYEKFPEARHSKILFKAQIAYIVEKLDSE